MAHSIQWCLLGLLLRADRRRHPGLAWRDGTCRIILFLLLFFGTIAAQAQAQDKPASPQPSATAPSPLPVKCIIIRDAGLVARLSGRLLHTEAGEKNIDGTLKTQKRVGCSDSYSAQQSRNSKLVGTGDIELVVSQEAYTKAAQHEATGNALLLYINGVALPKDGELIAVEYLGADAHLRYRINQGEDTQALWAMLYRDRGLLGEDSLRPAFGWRNAGPTGAVSQITLNEQVMPPVTIGITGEGQVAAAVGLLFLLFAGIYMIAQKTDALRDAPLPAWWVEAATLWSILRGLRANEQKEKIKGTYAEFDPASESTYAAEAESALAGRAVQPGRERFAVLGLALRKSRWTPVRAAFSLGRVQLAVWFTFAVAAGLFLWVIYGQLRRLDGSLLALLMVSVGTTAVSLGVDRNAGGRPYSPSKGFFSDLVTGFDDAHQVHRYQAVVVNFLLLFVGVSHVLQQLTYPIFDATWLALLGVSGAALGLGKQILEQPREPPLLPPASSARPSPAARGGGQGDGSVG